MSRSKHLIHSTSNDNHFVPKRFKQTKLHFGVSTIFVKKSPFVQKSSTSGTYTAESSIQTQLDLGQQNHRFFVCNSCGMVYIKSNTDDYQNHNSFHTNTEYASCLHLKHWLVKYSLISHDGNSIFHVHIHSPPSQIMRARLLWEYLQSDHGFALEDFDPDQLQLFGFLDKSVNKIVGLCFVEEVSSANRIVLNPLRSSSYSISAEIFPTQLGIVRLWVHDLHRRRNIATYLINCVRSRFLTGKCISTQQISFSQPSPDGVQFAIKYTGRRDFLIYLK